MPCNATVTGTSCAPKEEIDAYFLMSTTHHFFVFLSEQVDMSNITSPIQPSSGSRRMKLGKTEKYGMSVNEFIDNRDQAGFFPTRNEPYRYFTVEDDSEIIDRTDDGAIAQVLFELSDKRYTYERSAYTFLVLISDVGGFNGAIFLFQRFILRFYSSHLFQSKLAQEMPVRRPRRRAARKTRNELTL